MSHKRTMESFERKYRRSTEKNVLFDKKHLEAGFKEMTYSREIRRLIAALKRKGWGRR